MNQDIRIQLDFEVTPELVELYRDSTDSPFLGYKTPLTLDEAWEKMVGYSLSQTYGKFKRLAIMKIFLGDELIGFSFPRQIVSKEFSKYKIPGSVNWYRLGTIFIDKAYRGKGIIEVVVGLFRESYPNLIWQCDAENMASCKAALKTGFLFSHQYYMDEELNSYVFEPHYLFPKAYKVFIHKEFKTIPASFTRTNFFYELSGNIVDLREIVSAKKISLTYGYAIEIVLRNGVTTKSGCYYTEEVLNKAYDKLVKKLTSL